jgi:hypothetical protein
MGSPCLSKAIDACRTSYSVHRSLLDVCPPEKARPQGVPARAVPARFLESDGSTFHRLRPPSETPSGALPLTRRRQAAASFGSSSHEVLRPSSAQARRVGISSGSNRNAIPLRPLSDPWGLDPHRALRPCCMPLTLLGFSTLQGLFLPQNSTGLITRRNPPDVSPSCTSPSEPASRRNRARRATYSQARGARGFLPWSGVVCRRAGVGPRVR